MLNIGCHLSSSKGFLHMGREALLIGGNTFQFFTRNPRGGKAKDIDPVDVQRLIKLMKDNKFSQILVHAPYTMNVCSKDEGIREFAQEIMADDLKRMEYLPFNLYNFHPGSHVGQGVDRGIEFIVDALNKTLFKDMRTTVLLETMAGKGTEIGRSFEELRDIIDRVDLNEKMGVCLDTCHVHDAGYDIVNDLDGVLTKFDNTVGLKRLKALHINDSKNPLESHKDRHEKIGDGNIGIEAFERIVNHPALKNLPMFLETPNDLDGYKREIKMLRDLQRD